MTLIVYKGTPSTRSWAFSNPRRCDNWREANKVRQQIAADAARDKDNSSPLVYDANGNFVVEGWQK